MPNRVIKESLCTSEKISSLTDFEFRLWIGLITQADDAGRGDARSAIIKGRVFPLRDRLTVKDIDASLQALAAKGCVSLYTVDGKPYFWFPGWAKHQRVRDCKPKYPEPPADTFCGSLPQPAADGGETRPESNPIQIQSESESKTEKGACPRFSPPSPQEVDDYCREKGYQGVDGQVFCDYYASKGWKVGQTAMKDWRAAVRTWVRRRAQEGGNGQHGTPHAENRGQPALDVNKLKYREGLV